MLLFTVSFMFLRECRAAVSALRALFAVAGLILVGDAAQAQLIGRTPAPRCERLALAWNDAGGLSGHVALMAPTSPGSS